VATAIRIGRPARGEQAIQAAEESGGRIIAVSDAAILAMQRRLAQEGVWVEPASAAGLAGLAHEIDHGRLDPRGQRIVAVCTGHGLKDPEIIVKQMGEVEVLPVEMEALEEAILSSPPTPSPGTQTVPGEGAGGEAESEASNAQKTPRPNHLHDSSSRPR
jgi:threonine synthase